MDPRALAVDAWRRAPLSPAPGRPGPAPFPVFGRPPATGARGVVGERSVYDHEFGDAEPPPDGPPSSEATLADCTAMIKKAAMGIRSIRETLERERERDRHARAINAPGAPGAPGGPGATGGLLDRSA